MKLLLENWRQYLNEASGEFYHVAPTRLREEIRTNGISIVANRRYGVSKKSVIYAWECYELALWYALTEGRDHETSFDIWKIENPPSQTPDDSIGVDYAVIFSESIPPENIDLVDTAKVRDERAGTSAADIDYVFDEIEDMK
jgi:hypothetical protein|tara:strand:+ start:833 stop:1258 length:426 start_codon:yes stop_codon:yes gene_type:complete